MNGPIAIRVNGADTDSVPAHDRGLQYGDGLFETILVRRRIPRFLEAHLARLTLGCDRLGIRIHEYLASLRAEIREMTAIAPELAVIKIVVTRGSATRRGYAPLGNESTRRIVSLWPAAPLPAATLDGVDLGLAAGRVASNPQLAGIKHLCRLENVLALRDAEQAGFFDALLRDADGNLVSGAMSNLFIVKDRHLRTPRIEQAGVAGVLRSIVLREARRLGLDATEDLLTLTDLASADEVFITNVRIGVVPARRVGEHRFDMSTVARQLASHLEALDA
jgi:4-amino-4-deoxychorismate lyase